MADIDQHLHTLWRSGEVTDERVAKLANNNIAVLQDVVENYRCPHLNVPGKYVDAGTAEVRLAAAAAIVRILDGKL